MKYDVFYLTGNEMFLEAMLDACWELGPMTDTRWNNNRVADKTIRADTPSSRPRTDLRLNINSNHPYVLFIVIPTNITVLCAMNAITRCVEKFVISRTTTYTV